MKMRLIILTEIISPYRIPVFNALAQLPEIDLHVIFLAETDTSMRQWRVYTDEIRFSYQVLPSWRQRLGKHNLLVNKNVSVALGRACPDVILCGGYNYLASWQSLRWAKRNRVPLLLWCESTSSDQRNLYRPVEVLKQRFLIECAGFVVPGKSAFAYVRQLTQSQHIFIAPNTVDIELFSSRAEQARLQRSRLCGEVGLPERYFLYVGRLVQAKGVRDLLEAYAGLDSLLREQVGLVLVGDGPMRAELEAVSRSIFPGIVHFPGFCQREELPAYYALAECLVLPTYSDTWGLVINEALACGLPIICSRVAGCAADLVTSNGRLITPGNVLELMAAMAEVAADPLLRNEMCSESRKLIQNYTPARCALGIAEAALTIGSPQGHDDRNDDHLPMAAPAV
jgi:glycosyltransferase involved in cell wall biosynthesis